jgi:hypothetical protein
VTSVSNNLNSAATVDGRIVLPTNVDPESSLLSGFICFLHVQVSSSKQDGIDRKCARPEHRRGCADGCQHNRNPRITNMGHCDPQFDERDQRSHERRPKSDQKKHGGARPDDVRNHRYGKG